MSGKISNIWKPIFAEINLLLFLGVLISFLTNKSIFIIPIFYFCALIIFYCWHYYAHNSNGVINKKHMMHHNIYFKHDDFYGDHSNFIKNYFNNNVSTFINLLLSPQKSVTLDFAHDESLIFMFILLLIFSKFVCNVDNISIISCFIIISIAVLFQIAIHTSYHIRDFEFEKYAWFRELRSLHYNHHIHKKIFSMINMLIDLLFNSLVI